MMRDCVDSKGEPVCPICLGINPDSGIPEEIEDSPVGAKCTDCGFIATKKYLEGWKDGIPPFYNPISKHFYCGCRGWN